MPQNPQVIGGRGRLDGPKRVMGQIARMFPLCSPVDAGSGRGPPAPIELRIICYYWCLHYFGQEYAYSPDTHTKCNCFGFMLFIIVLGRQLNCFSPIHHTTKFRNSRNARGF